MSEPMSAIAPPKPPRKWLGRKGGLIIVGAGAVLWFGTVLFEVVVFGVKEAPTNALVIGGFTVASAFVYTMAYRLRPSDGLSITRLLLAFLVGGILAALLAAPIDALANLWSGGSPAFLSLVSLSLAGVIEEFVKIALVLVFAIRLGRKSVRNGLFLGGAVGFGFAAFEDMSYARQAWNNAVAFGSPVLPAEIFSVVSRDIMGIFGHPLFTALLAAAIFAGVRNDRFRLTWLAIVAYLGVAFAHGLFDFSSVYVGRTTDNEFLNAVTFYTVAVVEAVVLSLIWRVVARRAKAPFVHGLRVATERDRSFLRTMLAEAFNWQANHHVTLRRLKRDSAIWHYVDGWKRPNDFGVVWFDHRRPLGAAWARTFTAEDAGYGFVDAAIPEISMAVDYEARGQGGGSLLLRGLVAHARARGVRGLSLSVEDGNAAARSLYESAGFTVVGRVGNSDTMMLALEPLAAPGSVPAADTVLAAHTIAEPAS
jgi:RsiW-degrading membrane proteinase PrsW (M82 family)/ribosomal protein S18 acetylase RimI-like enzyme